MMKFSKEVAIMLALASLLLSAIGAAVYLYMENEKTKKENSQLVTVYVAKKHIKKNELITQDLLSKTVIQKKFILTKPLLLNDILNKFARVDIFKNESFIAEKLVKSLDYQEGIKHLPFKHNSYNFNLKLFQNPNYTLSKGDTLKIASVYPRSKDKKNLKFKVQYVAENIKVIGFVEKGKIVEKTFRFVKQLVPAKKNKKAKKDVYQTVKVFADEIVLDMPNKVILDLLNDYNKDKQLWMVKTNEVKPKVVKAVIEKIPTKTKKTSKPKKWTPRVYKYQMYIPRNTSYRQNAVIEYVDKKVPTKSSSAVIRTNMQRQCSEIKQYLIGSSRKVYLRKAPLSNGKIARQIYRNYIIPYKRAVNNNWFEVCDGTFVHKNEATYINSQRVEGLLGGNKTKK